jgi:hypothetical protein
MPTFNLVTEKRLSHATPGVPSPMTKCTVSVNRRESLNSCNDPREVLTNRLSRINVDAPGRQLPGSVGDVLWICLWSVDKCTRRQ